MVPGQPVAKGRHKTARRGNFLTHYTPEKTANYESLVAHAGHIAMAGRALIAGPVSMDIDIRLQIPKSWPDSRQRMAAEGLIAATKKPDIDNVFKAIADGINGVVLRDDSQIVQTSNIKRYSRTPGVVVIVRELDMKVA